MSERCHRMESVLGSLFGPAPRRRKPKPEETPEQKAERKRAKDARVAQIKARRAIWTNSSAEEKEAYHAYVEENRVEIFAGRGSGLIRHFPEWLTQQTTL